MTARILAALAALTIGVAAAAPAASAGPAPTFVDMDDNGHYSRGDLRIDKLGGYRQLDGGKVLVGSVGSGENRFTLLYVLNGHDLHVNGRLAGHNLAIVNRGGDIHVGAGAQIVASGPQFALATRRGPAGATVGGALRVDAAARIEHSYPAGRARQVQIETGDLTLAAGVDVSSLPARATGRATARAQDGTGLAHVLVTGTLERHPTAAVRGLPIVGPKQP